jgi:hypothetical protein
MAPGTLNPQKSDTAIFFNFHDPGYMKIHKIQTIWFSSIFMILGTWKFTKIKHFDFLQLSWPRVHENPQNSEAWIFFNFNFVCTWKFTKIRTFDFLQLSWSWVHENPQKSDTLIFFNFHDSGYMKIHKNQTLRFSSTLMIPGTWKSTKIRRFDFLQLSWPRVHENL